MSRVLSQQTSIAGDLIAKKRRNKKKGAARAPFEVGSVFGEIIKL
jgi:hypothetical protein